MPCPSLKNYLDKYHIPYLSIQHAPAPTAQEIAHEAHISGKLFAKPVIIKISELYAMVVIPANRHLNFEALRRTLREENLGLSSESEFMHCFPDCAAGMMPPLGNIYNMETYLSDRMKQDGIIAFNAGVDDELVQISYHDYEALVHPKILIGIA